MSQRLIIGITGSSGVILGIRLLQVLQQLRYETHLVISENAQELILYETSYTLNDVQKLASHVYACTDFFAAIASGSFLTHGMTIIPCSMKTLAGIACGYADNLLLRAADVCLKERRRLVLVTRETPLSLIHIENMRTATLAGAIILPPVFTCYGKPENMGQMIDHIVGKVLDTMGVENNLYPRWQ